MNFKPIKRLFIANRGEILRRIALSAKKLGIETATLLQGQQIPGYLHPGLIDFFIMSPHESVKDYLDIEKMLATARDLGCDALHPGFGFLSENADFAAAVEKSGLIWIGPPVEAIRKMASKATAGEIADKLKIPRVQSLKNITMANLESRLEEAYAFGARNSYPLLIKAAYGGGGKGMRIVDEESGLSEAIKRAASEAKNAFGNDLLIIEKYLPVTRHIEVQIIADTDGQVGIIGDRDCSIQRRHQKIIEEAPAPGLYEETRRVLHQAAKSLAQAVNYQSAGTVEFMLREENERQEIYFLEMNTRLQVEHPVTEESFGIDLVAWQLRIAMGEKLNDNLLSPSARGHSIEVRLYAEDPENNFFPSPGTVNYFEAMQGPGVRWEIGVASGEEITGSFDPMFAKLVVKDEDRDSAIARLRQALKQSIFFGPRNNIAFLDQVLADADFQHVKYNTHYLQEKLRLFCDNIKSKQEDTRKLATVILAHPPKLGTVPQDDIAPQDLSLMIYSQKAHDETKTPILEEEGVSNNVCVHYNKSSQSYYPARNGYVGKGHIQIEHGKFIPFCYAEYNNPHEFQKFLHIDGTYLSFTEKKELGLKDSSSGEGGNHDIESPVPGKIIMVACQVGKNMEKGERLFVLESMKMEYEIVAPIAGTLTQILVKEGDAVLANQKLAHWE